MQIIATAANKVVSNAKKMMRDGVVYAYGFKYTKLTPYDVIAMAELYPKQYTNEKLKMTLAKVGKIGVDCSGFLCKAANIPFVSSTKIQQNAEEFWSVHDTSHLQNGMYVWRDGHVGIIEIDNAGTAWILEARTVTKDLQRSKFSARGVYFTYYGKIMGVNY